MNEQQARAHDRLIDLGVFFFMASLVYLIIKQGRVWIEHGFSWSIIVFTVVMAVGLMIGLTAWIKLAIPLLIRFGELRRKGKLGRMIDVRLYINPPQLPTNPFAERKYLPFYARLFPKTGVFKNNQKVTNYEQGRNKPKKPTIPS